MNIFGPEVKINLSMKFKYKIIAVAFLLTTGTSAIFAQQKEITLQDAILGRQSKFGEERLRGLQWIKTTNKYSYIDGKNLMIGSVADTKASSALSLNELATTTGESLKGWPQLNWIDADQFKFTSNGKLFLINLKSKSAKTLNTFIKDAENLDIEPSTGNAAFTKGDNLFVTINGKETQVTNETQWGIKNGKSTHREEFGISKGTFWSTKGNLLAFYREDATMVTDYPLVNTDERPAKLENIKYPMAGMKSHEVTVGVYNPSTGKTIFLQTGEPKEQYLTNIHWSIDEKSIYIAVLNRDQNELKYNQYDAVSGSFVKTLFTETHPKYVHPEHEAINLKTSFLWQSETKGFNHFYQYDLTGKLIKHINTGKIIVRKYLGIDANETKIYFTGNHADSIDMQVFMVDITKKTNKQGEFTAVRLSKENGFHDQASLSTDGKYILDQFSSPTVPLKINLLSSDGKIVSTLLNSKNPLSEYKFGTNELIRLKAEDGSLLYGRMIKPFDFNPNKKYPVVVYVYNGPNVQMVTNTWTTGATYWMYYLANKGYIVFTVDGRGSKNRGQAFEQATFRHLGQQEMKDQLTGVSYLKSLPYVNADKMAVHGWSYGGFMTTSLMTNYPDVFKVGVAGGPVIDWSYYEVMYTERYMDTPQTNSEGFAQTSLLDKTKNLKGNLLLIHGTVDPVVVWQHSQNFIKKCVENGVPVDYFVYPGHEHNVTGKDRVHLYNKVIEYIDEKLNKPDTAIKASNN
ncbi:DPP IV N-terminal domain-containing protein [Solitalea sp. MAHUQ-68]|uniref:DPP IV N-terminal domain-containing protein n=1 Tax=Solitalea agri TaxID=2953739 RepID=A0A9X2F4E9_9SPHI|nr:DPP IV N-terminal domain-containing protein [Solitalea agri]MCO4291633.1 DPP IV N-terminal domain-containing protein [Solitalea agri]